MTERLWRVAWDAYRAPNQGWEAMRRRQQERLAEMVAFARDRSPYYRKYYRQLPTRIADPGVAPVTDKSQLMAHFDEWVTDHQVTFDQVNRFVENRDLVGERFLGRYTLAVTSGTTGQRGIFVLDDRTMEVTTALTIRMLRAWLGAGDVVKIIAGKGRIAMVNATGGHFASAVAAARLGNNHRRRQTIRVFGVHTPAAELVAQLNQFRPAVVAAYASAAELLADEQHAGRLHIQPTLITLSAEGLPAGEYERIGNVFHAKVREGYAATECPFLSYSCVHGWLHVNTDWVVFEPVDTDYRPVPPGQLSHTVLVTNLANRVQPILRYDLGDSILERPDPCPCGNPPPAIRVQGRTADALTFPAAIGEHITLAPLVFATLADRTPGIERFQLIQTTPTTLRLRLRPTATADFEQVWEALHGQIQQLLTDHGLRDIRVERAEEPPEPTAAGKYRTIVPLQ